MSMNCLTFHGFKCLVECHIFANRNEEIVESCRRSATITGNYAAYVRQNMSNEVSVNDAALSERQHGTHSQTCSKTAVKYKAAGATKGAWGGTR